MLDHADIWRAIDRLAESRRLSASGLARRAGLDPTAFNRSKRVTRQGKPRWPSTETVAKVLNATGASFAEFVALIDADAARPGGQRMPLLACTEAGAVGVFDGAGRPTGGQWEFVEAAFPEDPNAYALLIACGRMGPVYRDGDLIILSPAADVRRGNRVAVKTADGKVLIEELADRTPREVELMPLGATGGRRTLPANEIAWMTRIVWATQ